MLARVHATIPGAPSERPGSRAPADGADGVRVGGALLFARYLDVVLVIAGAPLVLLAGMPRLGYALGGGGWIVIRFASELVKRRAWSARNAGVRTALHLTAILGRVWMIAVVVLAARFAGSNSDGITAAVVVLAAFTVELTIAVVLRAPLAAEAGRSR